MEELGYLVADDRPVELVQSGITLIAPGLSGTITCHGLRASGISRDLTGELTMLDTALAEAGLEDRYTLVAEAETPTGTRAGLSRGLSGVAGDEMLLQVPGGDQEYQFLIYKDEAGIVSLHYPEPIEPGNALTSRAIGAAHLHRYHLKLRSTRVQAGPEGGRGLFSAQVAKVIKVVVGKLLSKPVGKMAHAAIQGWENRCRSFQGLHGGSNFDDLIADQPIPFNSFDTIRGRRALLFIHGTTSRSAGAFAGLMHLPTLIDDLYRCYADQVIGFNHHTMSVGVAENVRQFWEGFRDHPGRYEFDIVCHSRGGLVARAITGLDEQAIRDATGEQTWSRPVGVDISIRRIVFVATPNGGTDLAIPGNIPAFIDRIVNVVNFLPDSAITIGIGGLLALASAIAEAGLPYVPGLADQAPGSKLLTALRNGGSSAVDYYAFQADYEPSGSFMDAVKDAAMDRLFGDKPNDLVVPTDGVSNNAAFSLLSSRVMSFSRNDGVHHTNFFSQPQMNKLYGFLGCTEARAA